MISNKEAVEIYTRGNGIFSKKDKEKLELCLNCVDEEGFNEYSEEELENKLMFYQENRYWLYLKYSLMKDGLVIDEIK